MPPLKMSPGGGRELGERFDDVGENVVALNHWRAYVRLVGDARDGAARDQRRTVSSSSEAGNGQSTPHLLSRQPSASSLTFS